MLHISFSKPAYDPLNLKINKITKPRTIYLSWQEKKRNLFGTGNK